MNGYSLTTDVSVQSRYIRIVDLEVVSGIQPRVLGLPRNQTPA